jgi:hypothetical protein
MMGMDAMPWGMGGAAIVSVLIVAALVLAIAALIKYLRS